MPQRRQSSTSLWSASNSGVAERTADDTQLKTPASNDKDSSQTSEGPQQNESPKTERGDGNNGDTGSCESDAGDTDQSIERRMDSTSVPTDNKDAGSEESDSTLTSQMAQMLAMMNQMQQRLQEMEAKVDHGVTAHHSHPNVVPETPLAPEMDTPPNPPSETPKSPSVRSEDYKSPQMERRITSFLDKARATHRPSTLKGSRNYEEWKQDLLNLIKHLPCTWILDHQQEDCPSYMTDRGSLWEVENEWLYGYISGAIDPFFLRKIRTPEKRSAYLLWAEIEACFDKSVEEERRLALYMLYTYRCPDDIEFINGFKERVQDIRMLGFTVPDWILMDLLWMGISERARDFVQLQIESRRSTKYLAVTLNVESLVASLLRHLSPNDAATRKGSPKPKIPPREPSEKGFSSSASRGDTDRSSKGVPSANLCRFCGMAYHTQRNCHYKHPELGSARWQKENRGIVEFLRTQTELRNLAKNSPRNKCFYCGMGMHVEDDCMFKYPETSSTTWQKKNKNLIEYFRRRAEGVQIETVHLNLAAREYSKTAKPSAQPSPPRPASPENLLIMDL